MRSTYEDLAINESETYNNMRHTNATRSVFRRVGIAEQRRRRSWSGQSEMINETENWIDCREEGERALGAWKRISSAHAVATESVRVKRGGERAQGRRSPQVLLVEAQEARRGASPGAQSLPAESRPRRIAVLMATGAVLRRIRFKVRFLEQRVRREYGEEWKTFEKSKEFELLRTEFSRYLNTASLQRCNAWAARAACPWGAWLSELCAHPVRDLCMEMKRFCSDVTSPAMRSGSAHMKFPPDYPYSPPSIRFLTKVWHPNVYEGSDVWSSGRSRALGALPSAPPTLPSGEDVSLKRREAAKSCFSGPQTGSSLMNGDLCISILHPPVHDPQSGELPCEMWNPTQNVRTILLSVISLLNEPNTFSPANVDASVMFRRWRDSKGKDKEYENIIRKQVSAARLEAEKDGVVVPLTLEDYCIKTKVKPPEHNVDMTDFYDDDYDLDDDDDDDNEGEGAESGDGEYEDGDDSGNGES
ncbi:Ubiquitin-conjugating enzyme E2 C [Gryllus bimaculatus]|nr:Ubiquitin-conjugating enzyme E2 C [Gryllus bimaculatus]